MYSGDALWACAHQFHGSVLRKNFLTTLTFTPSPVGPVPRLQLPRVCLSG